MASTTGLASIGTTAVNCLWSCSFCLRNVPTHPLRKAVQLESKRMAKSPTHVAQEGANSVPSSELAARPRVVAAADANEVMLEQLEYLIEHAKSGVCGSPQCQRYLRARSLLLDVFTDSPLAVSSASEP